MKTYKEFNGTSYDEGTDRAVISVIDNLLTLGSRTRIRIFYGDRETGMDWGEEYDTMGTVGFSGGTHKVPLLIANCKSFGGPAILTACIVRIDTKAGTVYRHPKYQLPEYKIEETKPPLPWMVSRTDRTPEEVVASFETEQKARNFVAFMRGERWSK